MSIAICVLLATPAGCATASRPPAGTRSAATAPSPTAAPATPSATAAPTSPSRPQQGETAPASVALIAFVQVRSDGSGDAAGEVSTPEQLDAFLTGPPVADQQVRDAVQRHRGPGVRLFAFVLTGCRNDGASLVIQQDRVSAFLTGGVGIQCFAAEQFLAVFAVPATLVPDRVRTG